MISSRRVRMAWPTGLESSTWALALLVLSLASGWSARADIIFSNFGPNDSYDPVDGWAVGAIDVNTVENIAVLFRVGSRSVTLDEVDVAMGFTNRPNAVSLEILPNVNGRPGPDSQALESFQLVNVLPPFGGEGPAVVAESVLHPLLQANTSYWLAATASEPTQALWNDNLLPYTDTVAYRDNNGPWTAMGIDSGPAFRVLGSPIAEPATLGLLGLGILGLFSFGCRRRIFARRV